MKELLNIYRVKFDKQIEIFKPPSNLKHFIEMVESLLKDNDLKMSLSCANNEISELKLKVSEMEKKNLELQLQLNRKTVEQPEIVFLNKPHRR